MSQSVGKLAVVILAAGQGTRMRSSLPKVLHRIADRPMLAHVIDTAHAIDADAIHVVYGHGGEQVRKAITDEAVSWVEQAEQLGTGHAVEQAMPSIDDAAQVLVLYGDVPLIKAATLRELCEAAADGVALLSVRLDDPTGYGRIVRDDAQRVVRIVEHKDASDEERAINEVNTGILVAPADKLRDWLSRLDNANVQGEFYLTDIVGLAVDDGVSVQGVISHDQAEVSGVNDRLQLSRLERDYQQRQAERLMREGVTMRDPQRFDLRGSLACGMDVEIDVNCIFEGEVELGDGVRVGPNCLIRNSRIAAGTTLLANSVIEDSEIGANGRIGPFARLRPESRLDESVHVGNFVEVKKSAIGRGSKVNHLSYIGDAEIGSGVNIGAGTITCNYDGAYKHKTVIGDDVFVGSATQLIAPVTLGDGATIGAGSTITRDAPAEALTLSRSKQQSIRGWKRPRKKE